MTKEARAEVDKMYLITKLLPPQAVFKNIDKANDMIISENEKLVKSMRKIYKLISIFLSLSLNL